MMGEAEFSFLMRMRDEASAIINRVSGSMGGLGNNTKKTKDDMQSLQREAARAAASIAAVFTSNRLAGGSLSAFREYDREMTVVQRVTDKTKEEMVAFTQQFDVMAERLKAVPVDRLGDIAGQAAQLGIVGTDEILRFTETIGKLETSLKDLGTDAPKLITRVLNATGEGVSGVEKFGNVLVRMGKDASSTEQRILNMTAILAQSTAQFKVSSESLLGLATAAADLNFMPELFGTATARTLNQLHEAALNNTRGMQTLSAMTGVTAEQFRELIKTDPAMAFVLFAEVLKEVGDGGKSTLGFLTQFNLQAQENQRILATAAQNTGEFRKQLAAAGLEAKQQIALSQEFGVTMGAFFAATNEANNAWTLFKKNFGGALAPGATAALSLFTDVLNSLSKTLLDLPNWARQAFAWTVVAVPAILGVAGAISAVVRVAGLLGAASGLRILGTAAGWAVALTAAVARAAVAFSGMLLWLTRIPALISLLGGVAVAIGGWPIAIAVAVGAVTVGLGLMVRRASENWEETKEFFRQPIGDIIKQAWEASKTTLTGWFDDFKTWGARKWEQATSFFKNTPAVELNIDADSAAKAAAKIKETFGLMAPFKVDTSQLSGVSDDNQKIIEELDERAKKLGDILKQETALAQLRRVGANDPFRRDRDLNDNELSRLEGLVALEKVRADATQWRLKTLREETREAASFGPALKAIAEQEAIIRDIREQKGALSKAEESALRGHVQLLQQARMLTDYRTSVQGMQRQVELMKIGGDYSRADRAAQEEINRLRDRGVQLTQAHVDALQEYHRAVDDATASQQSGFEGWARSIGTLRDGILDLQRSFADGFTNTLSEFFSTGKFGFREMMVDWTKQATQMLTKQAFGSIFEKIGNNIGGLFSGLSSSDALGRASGAADKLQSMTATTAMMTVNASMVNLTGGLGVGGGFGFNPFSFMGGGGGTDFGSIPNPMAWAGIAHKGGVIGQDNFPGRMLPAAMFKNAPRLHQGLKDDEFAAVLQRGERVLRADDNKRMMNVMRQAGSKGGGLVYSPSINLSTGPSGGGMSEAQSRRVSRALDDGLKSLVVDVMLREQRPGGAFHEAA